MKTLRIVSSDQATQGPFVTIDVADFVIGLHEPFSEEDIAALQDAPRIAIDMVPGGVLSIEQMRAEFDAEVERVRITFAEERERLDARAAELNEQAEKLNGIQIEQVAERQRLEALAASLEAKGNDVTAHMTVPQIKDALTAKGIEIPAGANKAELLALLNPAA